MADQFKLPGSSYEEVVKIIRAYSAGKGQAMSLDTVAQAASMDKTIISRNNGFLIQCGLITEGSQKATTDIGNQLARAYSLKMDDEIKRLWKDCIEANEFMSRMLSAIKIRDTMEKSAFLNHIVYSSGASTTNHAKTGAATLIDLFELAGFIEEKDGQICSVVNSGEVEETNSSLQANVLNNTIQVPVSSAPISQVGTNVINININIDVSVENLDELTEKLKNLVEQLKR